MKLLVPVDGSPLSLHALQHTIALARAGLQVELVLVNVQDSASFYELVTLHDADALARVEQAAGEDLLAAAVQLAQAAGLPCLASVSVGDVVAMLVEQIEQQRCDAVVMGSRGGKLGSVSRAMLERSPVPVTFVKVDERDDIEEA